jgi:glycosyltransferase involved in cell wall biosynthesis
VSDTVPQSSQAKQRDDVRHDIAIVIPAYNAADTIAETLTSIQKQTEGLGRIFTVIVADDASSDETIALAKSVEKLDVPLEVIRNRDNLGERSTVNNAVRQLPPHVHWFFILHADDVAKPTWLGSMLRMIDRGDAQLGSVTASYDVMFEDGRVEKGEELGENRAVFIRGTPAAVADTLKRGCWWKVSSCAIRVSAFADLGGFNPNMPQLGDLDFVLRLLERGWNISYIPLCLSLYRQSAQSVGAVSFRIHRDVREWLRILRSMGHYLSPTERLVRFARLAMTLCRRMAASLLRGHWERTAGAATLLPLVIRDALQSVFAGTHPRSHTH